MDLVLYNVDAAFAKLLNGELLSPVEYMNAYDSIFQAISTPRGSVDTTYKYLCEILSAHLHTLADKAEVRDIPKLAPSGSPLQQIRGICGYFHHYHKDLEDVAAFTARTFREAAVEKLQSELQTDTQLLSDWLREATQGIRHGIEPCDDTTKLGHLFLEEYSQRQDDYEINFGVPFIRAAVAHYHEKAKELAAEDDPAAYEEKKYAILRLETTRGEVYLHDAPRRDYLDTLGELLDLGDEKFQR